MTHISANPEVVSDLLSRYTFSSYNDLLAAIAELAGGLRLSMQHTDAYSCPLAQALPAEVSRESAAPYLHPYNMACALHSVAAASTPPIPVPPDLLVHDGAAWVPVASVTVASVPIQVVAPPPPVAVIPPAPVALPPAPVIPPAPISQGDITALVDAALGPQPGAITPAALAAPSTVPATPVPPTHAPVQPVLAPTQHITTEEQYAEYRAAQGHPTPGFEVIDGTATRVVGSPPILGAGYGTAPVPAQDPLQGVAARTAPTTPPPQHVTFQEALAESENAEAAGLPDSSVTAEARGKAGRPKKSPFEHKVELRNKVAKAPFWWAFLLHSSKKLFAENPATALDPGSTGSGPVQAYALLVSLTQEILRCADGALTVAELRTFLREVETGMQALPSKDGIYQLVDHLFSGAEADPE